MFVTRNETADWGWDDDDDDDDTTKGSKSHKFLSANYTDICEDMGLSYFSEIEHWNRVLQAELDDNRNQVSEEETVIIEEIISTLTSVPLMLREPIATICNYMAYSPDGTLQEINECGM